MQSPLFSLDLQILGSGTLAFVTMVVTTLFHYDALRFLTRIPHGRRVSRGWIVGCLAALVAVHLCEIGLYAGAYALGTDVFALGGLRGSTGRHSFDFFYFAAETYSTLGYGDLVPLGALRLVAGVEALHGLILVSWSGAFLLIFLRDGVDELTLRARN